MEHVCPLCNGLTEANARCKRCGAKMEDAGMLSDYVGPYAPYELTAHVRQGNRGLCTHLLHCESCGNDTYAMIQSDWM